MLAINSSDVRKDWSAVIDSVVREKPVFIRRVRDHMMLCSTDTISQLVGNVKIMVDRYDEGDGSVTLSARGLGVAVNGKTMQEAKAALIRDLTEYAEEYYKDFDLYSRAPNRKDHLPIVIKILTARSSAELEEAVVCQAGQD